MGKIRLLVLDIDGTISGEANQVTPTVLTAIAAAQKQGVAVAIATGRMYRSALRFHQAVGSTLPLISYQGALIKDPTTQTLHRHTPLPRALALALLQALKDSEIRQDLSIHLYIDDQLHVRAILPETQGYAARSEVTPQAVGDLLAFLTQGPTRDTTKLLALSPDPEKTVAMRAQLRRQYPPEELYLTQSVATFFEATHPLAHKGAAVKFLAEDLMGLSPDQVMTVGDNFNDVEMLHYAGTAVAMGDAPAAVQAVADWVAPSVEVDGAAAAIEKFLLS
ncbi:Cof-type HAD-IIB family hydrolase [Leptolyngbya sp. PCC 6406]|uniref:Cof-type HAD-IIB family hydrolase n=1 Tax=Leptolyngbya sp. PCC 6406 TaxID=1173264 RepID=UPI0002ACC2BC|nr:Cof-type HAD-IIB family hydrolase [Leptolyngbya sp. PCC 6406]